MVLYVGLMFLSTLNDPYHTVLATREPKPVHPDAQRVLPLLDVLAELRDAEKALKKAKAGVPNYTAQWRDQDYYAQEQEDYNRALEAVAVKLAETIGSPITLTEEGPSPFQVSMSRTIEEAFPEVTPGERKYMDGLTYVGDLVAKLDKSSSSFNSKLTFKFWDVIRAIPARQGMENWVRP